MSRKADIEKTRFWQRTIQEAARSGLSIRAFCLQRRLNVSQFYWWQRRLKAVQPPSVGGDRPGGQASFALVSEAPETMVAGIELVLAGGRRLRINRGVDEATLRAVLAAME